MPASADMTAARIQRQRLAVLYAVLVAANIGAWVWAWTVFSDRPALLGLALLAWVFGLRHAIDADHIAVIDNTVRKLIEAGQRPIGVGFYFSLGHSTLVVLASVAIAQRPPRCMGRCAILPRSAV